MIEAPLPHFIGHFKENIFSSLNSPELTHVFIAWASGISEIAGLKNLKPQCWPSFGTTPTTWLEDRKLGTSAHFLPIMPLGPVEPHVWMLRPQTSSSDLKAVNRSQDVGSGLFP